MSWDISVQDLPVGVDKVENIPDDFEPQNLGSRQEIIAKILAIIPDVDFGNPSWGILNTDDYSIEFNMGDDVVCDGFMLHVRGGGEAAELIDILLAKMNLRALDCCEGDFFRLEKATQSFEDWQEFRDQVINDSLNQDSTEPNQC